MTAAKLGLCVPRPEPGEAGESKPKTPQMSLKEAMEISRKYAHPGGEVSRAGGYGGRQLTQGSVVLSTNLSCLITVITIFGTDNEPFDRGEMVFVPDRGKCCCLMDPGGVGVHLSPLCVVESRSVFGAKLVVVLAPLHGLAKMTGRT